MLLVSNDLFLTCEYVQLVMEIRSRHEQLWDHMWLGTLPRDFLQMKELASESARGTGHPIFAVREVLRIILSYECLEYAQKDTCYYCSFTSFWLVGR